MIGPLCSRLRAAYPIPGRLLGIVVILAASHAFAGQTAPKQSAGAAGSSPTAADEKRIAQAIAGLGSRSYTIREQSQRELRELGAAAQPALEKVVEESDDFEVLCQANEILDEFRLGLLPDTPPETVRQIKTFHLGDLSVKQEIAQELIQQNKRELLDRLIEQETQPLVREQLSGMLNGRVVRRGWPRRYAPAASAVAAPAPDARSRLANRDFYGAEKWLRDATGDAALLDFAAFLLAQNKLDAEIARVRTAAKPGNGDAQKRLAWFLRVKGDLPAAIEAAKAAHNTDLAGRLQAENGDWKELAKAEANTNLKELAANVREEGYYNRLTRIIVLRRLAGDKPGCDAAVAAWVQTTKINKLYGAVPLTAMVYSGHLDTGLDLLKAHSMISAFDLLTAQNRMQEAFRLAKINLHEPKIDWAAWLTALSLPSLQQRIMFAADVARAMHEAGEDDRAVELLQAAMNKGLESKAGDFPTFIGVQLVEAAVELDRPADADALAARLITNDALIAEYTINAMYGDLGEAVALLWKARREEWSSESQLATLQHLRKLLSDKPDAKTLAELGQLARRAEQLPYGDNREAVEAQRLLALAKLFRHAGDKTLLARYLPRLGSTDGVPAETLLDQGKFCVDAKEWAHAERCFSGAWNAEHRNAAALYALGWAQAKQDKANEGHRNMDLASILPLGDAQGRYELLQMLAFLGETKAAARQRQILLRTAGGAENAVLLALLDRSDGLKSATNEPGAAAEIERSIMRLVDSGVQFRKPRYYLDLEYALHRDRSLELLHAGKNAEAFDELHEAEAVLPENVELAIDCDAVLRKYGAAAEADALYHRIAARLEADIHDFPRAGLYRNNLAWLAANLDRDLDMALANAKRAVELEPRSAGILDTLAEVHYRRGNRALAVELAKRCVELDGSRDKLYQQRLEHFAK